MAEVADRSISVLNRALDEVSNGDMTSRVDLSSISKEYYETGEKINEMIEATSKNIRELKDEREYISEIFATMPDPSYDLMDIPVVILTTSEDEDDIARAYHHHANSYLVKPSDIDKFGEMMKETYSYWLRWNRCPK